VLLRALHLTAVRNLAATTLAPAPRFNVISGDNGQGKTNLLEAIYLAGTLRSFRTASSQEIIAWGADEARVAARVERAGIERVYEVELGRHGKQARLDGKVPRSVSEYFGDFNVVLFAPEDLRVPRGSPSGRRRFLDRSVFNRQVGFLADAQRYARVLKSRNALLRSPAPPPQPELLDVYDAQLAEAGACVLGARLRYLAELAPRFAAAYEAITHTGLAAELRYQSDPAFERPEEAELQARLLAATTASRRRDLARRQTHVGPHVDDVVFLLGGHEARAYASQGQLRALVLAWKTAEMELLREVHGESPLLLLDDVSSELDAARNTYLFAFLDRIECQCFVTTTHRRHVRVSENRQDFQIVAGVLETP
jgi:DNA replication and repair protein RecF